MANTRPVAALAAPSGKAESGATSGVSRGYRMGRRQDAVDRTRRRILEAATELQATRGPSATTMSAVAEAAGVTRATLYRHFATEAELLHAAQAEWASRHQPPEPATWAELADPGSRLRAGLTDLYAWYRATAAMTASLLHDGGTGREGQSDDAIRSLPDRAQAALIPGWPSRAVAPLLPAAIQLATRFDTWRSITAGGLHDDEAVELMARLARSAAGEGASTDSARAPRPPRSKASDGRRRAADHADAPAGGPSASATVTEAGPPDRERKQKSGKGKGGRKHKGDRKAKG